MVTLTVVDVLCFRLIGRDCLSSSFSWPSAGGEGFVPFVVALCLVAVAIVILVGPGRHLLEVVLLKSLPNDVDVDVAFARGYFVSQSGVVVGPPLFAAAAAAGWIPA